MSHSALDTAGAPFGPAVLAIDCAAELRRIESFLVHTVARRLNRRGVVLGVSGGVDSAVCAAIATRAIGPERVFALLMPERDSPADGTARALDLCERLRLPHAIVDITATLEAIGCYHQRDQAIRRLFPEYGPGWRQKIALGNTAQADGLPFFNLVVASPDGRLHTRRMPADVYLQVVSATNFKQRIRKTVEYHHAERLNHAVLGTPNKLEYDLGFFVRGGDGLADLKPIAHLYKTQVYALAAHLGIPEDIRRQPPSTDTYSLPQTQEEFYFALPYQGADLLLWAIDHQVPADLAGRALGLDAEQYRAAVRDIAAKRRLAARTLADAWLVEEEDGVPGRPER